MMARFFSTVLLLNLALCSAWTPSNSAPVNKAESCQQRRDFFGYAASIVGSAVFLPEPTLAAAVSQDQKDKDNIVKGYNRLQYLLDNWENETTVCKTGQETTWGDKCERTPIKVMDYLGFKNMNDPLFNADKAMLRLKGYVPADKETDYYEAVEKFAENAEEASSMAFVSSWGEANPGGGKDRVIVFIERSKKNVIASRDSLKTVIDLLNL